jgi:hypothetical protein
MLMQSWTRGIGSPDALVAGAAGGPVHQFIEEDPAHPASAIADAYRIAPSPNRFDDFPISLLLTSVAGVPAIVFQGYLESNEPKIHFPESASLSDGCYMGMTDIE